MDGNTKITKIKKCKVSIEFKQPEKIIPTDEIKYYVYIIVYYKNITLYITKTSPCILQKHHLVYYKNITLYITKTSPCIFEIPEPFNKGDVYFYLTTVYNSNIETCSNTFYIK